MPQEAFDTGSKGKAALLPAARHNTELCLQATFCDRDNVRDL